MNLNLEQLKKSGYRVVSRRHCQASRIDRPDWREYMAKKHSLWDPKGQGMDWANSPGMGDQYRRVYSKDVIILTPSMLKLLPGSGAGPDTYFELVK